MRQRNFVWSLGGKGTGPGWIPENAPNGWYPGNGFLASHDLIEHLSNKGDWEHELRATGVSAYDVGGVDHRDLKSITEDVVSFAARDHHFRVKPAPARWLKPLPDAADEARVQELIAEIARQTREGMARAAREHADVPKEAVANAPTFAERATPWIRLGYAGAVRVYGKGEGDATGRLMGRVRDAINSDHDKSIPLKGDRMELAVDTRAKTFTLKRVMAKPEMNKHDRFFASLMEDFDSAIMGAHA